MRVFIDQKVEASTDRAMDVAIVAIVLVALIGLFTADGPVPLQVDEGGFTSRVPALVAAIVYPACGLLLRMARLSSAPWVRWLGRTLIVFILCFEVLAFASAS